MTVQNAQAMSLAHGGGRGRVHRSSRDLPAAAGSGVCVLLTGKREAAEALAYRIHSLSPWKHGAFLVVDCAWPEWRVESALFGTNGTQQEPGTRILGGTVLLQEVGHLSASFQAVLAQRLADIRGDLSFGRPPRRLMASTSEPLLGRVLDGTFNHHLYYRLNVIHMVVADYRIE